MNNEEFLVKKNLDNEDDIMVVLDVDQQGDEVFRKKSNVMKVVAFLR